MGDSTAVTVNGRRHEVDTEDDTPLLYVLRNHLNLKGTRLEWTPRNAAGHGIAYARYKNTSAYCAVVAEVEAVEQVRVRSLPLTPEQLIAAMPD